MTEVPVEALRTLFLNDLLSRPLTTPSQEKQTGGLVDRKGQSWVVFDIDGTREAARQRSLPKTEDLPPSFRRLDDICAPGYTGRKREQCQWNGGATAKPRQVSVLLHPVTVGSALILWHDWGRRIHRRACIHLLRHQRVEVQVESGDVTPAVPLAPLSRAKRAHYRLTWAQRLARNARPETDGQITIRVFGVPKHFATSLGLAAA
ncbi:MAG TPA: hypothetical protein VFN02_04910 [Ktedonobacteraceae bacterium]|nr:hypothetical protein [Ktedonobacteraceae bacterium]